MIGSVLCKFAPAIQADNVVIVWAVRRIGSVPGKLFCSHAPAASLSDSQFSIIGSKASPQFLHLAALFTAPFWRPKWFRIRCHDFFYSPFSASLPSSGAPVQISSRHDWLTAVAHP